MTYFDNESASLSPTAELPPAAPPTLAPAPGQPPLAGSSAVATSPAVSKLAAKVAHELNNPLDAVLRFVSLAQRKARSGDYGDLDRHLADAQFGLQRMAEILRELMDVGRQTHELRSRPQPLPLSKLIDQALHTSSAQADQKEIRIFVSNSLPSHLTTPSYDLRLSQVLANLLKNAIEASPEQSSIQLATALSPEGRLTLTVTDAGPGIGAELIPQLFLPFVTTKPKGAGHGLGLAISRELVLSLGGTLYLDNRTPPHHGCIATILLPLQGS